LSAIQFVGDEPILRDLLIVTMTVFFIMAADGVVLPLYVRYTLRPLSVPILGALPSRLAIFLCVGAIGGLIGGLGVWQSRTSIRDPRQLLAGGAVILGVVSMWLGQTTNSVLAWSLDAARMFVMVVVTSYTMSFWQQHTPDDMQGRVLGVRRTAQGVVVPLGMVVGTYISVRTSPGDAVTALGVLLFVVGLGMFYRWRRGRAEIQEA
jgi:predicted small integral membrane protein